MSGKANNRCDHKIVIERTYEASIEDVWELWTTRRGNRIVVGSGRVLGKGSRARSESRWPDGICHDGGRDPPQVQFMKKAGMPLTTEARLTYTQIVPGKKRSPTLTGPISFPGIEPYNFGSKVDFFAVGGNVRMVLTLDPMHSDEWTQRSVMGMESQLGKLASVIASRGGK